jgi:4-amino-4-deoxychorismate lyase
MYPLFETVRVQDGEITHPIWHELRFAKSYQKLFGELPTFELFDGIQVPETCRSGLFKLKISFGKEGKQSNFEPYQVKSIQTLKVVEVGNLDYSIKYSAREKLNDVFNLKEKADDVLMVKSGWVTDTSYCNVVFFDGKKWITPEMPLLEGTARARLISEEKILPKPIQVDEIRQFESFKLINAMRDFEAISAESVSGIWI